MSSALEEVAATAEEVAAEQRQVARRARAMQRLRDRGLSWAQVLDREEAPPLLEMLRRNGRHLAEGTRRLARTFASGLSAVGASRRQIARRLAVSHQRVSAILNGEPRIDAASEHPH